LVLIFNERMCAVMRAAVSRQNIAVTCGEAPDLYLGGRMIQRDVGKWHFLTQTPDAQVLPRKLGRAMVEGGDGRSSPRLYCGLISTFRYSAISATSLASSMPG